jgi:hypothetical protein
VTLVEARAAVGGNLQVVSRQACAFTPKLTPPSPAQTHALPGGRTVEMGPRGCRPAGAAGAATLRLVHEAGLGAAVLPAMPDRPGASARFVYAAGAVRPLPATPGAFLRALAQPGSLGRVMLGGLAREVRLRGGGGGRLLPAGPPPRPPKPAVARSRGRRRPRGTWATRRCMPLPRGTLARPWPTRCWTRSASAFSAATQGS